MACWDDGAPALLQRQSPDHTHAIRVLDQSGRRPSLFTSPKQSDTNAGSGDTNFGYFQPSSAPIQEDRGSGRGGSKEEQRDRDTEAQKEPWMNRLEDMHCQGRSEGKGSRAGKGEDGVRRGGMRVRGKGRDEGG